MGYFNDKRKRESFTEDAARVLVNTAEKTGFPQEDRTGMKSACAACVSGSFSGDTGLRKPAGGFGSSEEIYGIACMGMLPAGEFSEERDFRMLQGMYPNEAKELLELVEEECDRLEYEGSPMFDEYPDYTTIYTLQKRIADAARKKAGVIRDDAGAGMAAENEEAGGDSTPEDLIRVMLLQEMHRRRSRYRNCRGVNAL
ncbi:MAG: hypothetical protein LUI14_07195 [Lachnospiraceae bacterium]|nr:hypothetical protein [Lachnospiraceae bacterium]